MLFAWLRIDGSTPLHNVQYHGIAYMLQQSSQALTETAIYLLLTFGFFYAIVSRFHHARKQGRAVIESATIFITWLIIQAILLACQYPNAEALATDAPALDEYRTPDSRFFLLVILASISHLALIATFTASVWQRKWHANNFGIHFVIGLPTALAMIVMSLPPSLIDLGNASWAFYIWFASMPLAFAISGATELRPPYLVKL